MPCLKIVPESYVNSDALDCLVHKYIYPKSHTIGGLSVDPAHAAEQMKLVKQLWYKENGSQLLHFILAFSPWKSERIKSAGELMPFAYDVCSCFADDYQIVFGIHCEKLDFGTSILLLIRSVLQLENDFCGKILYI